MASKPSLPTITWWTLTTSETAPVHARFDRAQRTICGGLVRGPRGGAIKAASEVSDIKARDKCQRCEAAIDRRKRMFGIR